MSLDVLSADIDKSVVIGDSHLLKDPTQCIHLLNRQSNRGHLTIITQNIRSLNCNFNNLQILLSRFHFEFDIIILTECWLSADSVIPIMSNYRSYSTQKYLNQNSGVVAYIREGLDAQVTEPDLDDANCLLITLRHKFVILGVYRPPCFRNIDPFITSLDLLLQSIKHYPNIIAIGDLNIDIKPQTNDNRSCDYLNTAAVHGLIPSHYLPTRLDNCLDHCLIKSRLAPLTFVCETTVTDHCCVFTSISNLGALATNKYRVQSKTMFKTASEEISTVDWGQVMECYDANTAADLFLSSILAILDKHTGSHVVPNRRKTHKPWITPGLLRCIRFRDRLHIKLRNQPHNQILQVSYKRYRNTCNRILNDVKRNYERDLINKNKNNLKKTWEVIKDICHINKQKSQPFDILKLKHNPQESVNFINEYFSNVGQNLAEKMLSNHHQNNQPANNYYASPVNSIVLLPTDATEIKTLILSLKKQHFYRMGRNFIFIP